MKVRLVLVALVLASLSFGAQGATVLWDEAIDGDASDASSSFTPLAAVLGENIIRGSRSWPVGGPSDYDFYSITLASGLQIDSITAVISNGYQDPAGGLVGRFYVGLTETTELNQDRLLNWQLFVDGTITGATPSYPLKNDIFYLALAGGAKLGDTSIGLDYEWSINVTPIPIPAAAWLFGSSLGLLCWLRGKMA
jgi:hypothetical protein